MSKKVLINKSIFKTIKYGAISLSVDIKTLTERLDDVENIDYQYVKKVFVLGRFYKNIKMASEDLGINRTTLSNRLKSDNFLGYWLDGHGDINEHINEESEVILPKIEEMIYVDGRVFKSLYEASKELGLNRNSVKYRIKSDKPKWSKWCYTSDKMAVYTAMLSEPTDGSNSNFNFNSKDKCVPPLGGSETKNIRCMIDGLIYDSVKEASEQTRIKYRTLLSRLHSDSNKFEEYIILNNTRKLFLEDNLSARHGGNDYSYDEDFETDDYFEELFREQGLDLDDY